MGLWAEGSPGLLSGRKKDKSRGGVPALGLNPHHLRRTEERKSAPEAPAWTPRWSVNHVNQRVFWSGAEAETNELPKNTVYSKKKTGFIFYILEKKEASHICLLQRNKLFIKRNCKVSFLEKHEFDLGNTCQSRYLYENMKWSHGHYGHFAPSGFPLNPL